MSQGSAQHQTLIAWDARRYARSLDPAHVKYSRGFLRCRPEKWFPGFAAHWLPLAHSLGVEIKLVEAKPLLLMPKGMRTGFACTVDDEPLGIFLDDVSTAVILEAVSPGATVQAGNVVAEYLARRLLTSLVTSWSGPESSLVRFESEMNPFQINSIGAIKLTFALNTNHCSVWITIGKLLADRLDGLWRRQIRAAAKQGDELQEVQLEIAQLAVPPAMLVDYLHSGTVIDLEVPAGDSLTLRLGGKPWLPARLCEIGGNFAFEILAGPVAGASLPEGTTRLSISFGSITLDASQVSELAQVGACWDTGLPVSDQVNMIINGERVSAATLGCFEGRYAITVA